MRHNGGGPSGCLLAVSTAGVLLSALVGLLGNVVTSGRLPFGLEPYRRWAPVALVAGLVLVLAVALVQLFVERREDASEPDQESGARRTWLVAPAVPGCLALLVLALRATNAIPSALGTASVIFVVLASAVTCAAVSARFVWWRRQLKPLPAVLRRLLDRQCETASLNHGYDYWDGTAPPLPDIYVEQRAEYLLPSPMAARSKDRAGPLTLAQMLHRSRFSVVVAEPGVGKSTSVARVLHEQSAWWLNARRTADPEDAPYGPSVPIALPVDLHGCDSLPEAMAVACERLTGKESPARMFDASPPGGRSWLILLDGIDQILLTQERKEVLARLGGWIERSPARYRLMITTRPLLGGELGRLGTDHVGWYVLQRFDEAGLRKFIAQWVAYRRNHHVSGIEAAPITVERFMASVASASLSSLARTPLIATITALVLEWSQEADLPTSRAGLYERYVQQLLTSRQLQTMPPSPEFDAAGAAGERAWSWLRDNVRALLEGVADRHLSPVSPSLTKCAIAWVKERSGGLLDAVPGWEGALGRLLTATSLIVPGPHGLRFVHPSFAEYLAAGPRAEAFDLDTWLADALSPDSRNLALFILARLPRRRQTAARPSEAGVADALVDILLGRGRTETCVAGAIVADGIEMSDPLRLRVIDDLMRQLAQEDQTTAEAIRVLIDLTADPAILDRLTRFVEDADNPGWVRADTAEELCGVARETGIRLLRRVLGTVDDSFLEYRILLLLTDFGEATADERARAEHHQLTIPRTGTAGVSAGHWMRQIAGSTTALPRHRLSAVLAMAQRREPGWDDHFADVILDGALAVEERLEAGRAVARLAAPDGAGSAGVPLLRRIADAEGNPLDVRVPLLAALAAEQDQAARRTLNGLARTGGEEFAERFPFAAAWEVSAGTRSSELAPEITRGDGRVPEVWGGVPPRNQYFSGREDMLARLRASMATGAVAMVPRVLHGLGGIGKTQLALEYAYRYAADYDLVWWIPSEQPVSIRSSLASLATHLGLPHANTIGVEETAQAVLDALRRGSPYSRWLLIFDNAGEPEDLRHLIPDGPGHVLITSRSRRWEALLDTVDLDVWSRQESLDFLTARASQAIGGPTADRLAEELGDLPLALEQAAAYMVETGTPAEEYLALLRERMSEVLAEGPTAYTTPVSAAWTLSITNLRESLPEAVDLLRCCAFFGAEPIPRGVFSGSALAEIASPLSRLLEDPILLSRAIRELGRYALARIDHAHNTIQVHRLVQTVVREELTGAERQRVRDDARLLLAGYAPPDPADPKTWNVYAGLLPHVEPLAVAESTNPAVRAFALDVVRYLHLSGDYDTARLMAERLIAAWSAEPGEDGSRIAHAHQLFGDILRALGDYQAAYEIDTATLARLESTVGTDHEATLRSMMSIATDLRGRGEFSAARVRDEETLAHCEWLYGSQHPETCRVLNNLALDLALSSDFPGARALHQRAYEAYRSAALGEDTLLLGIRSDLARAVGLCGDYSAARDLSVDAYASSVDSLGARHPRTLRTAVDLATAERRSGDFRASLEHATDAHGELDRLLGPDHPDTLAAATCLAMSRRAVGDLEAALGLADATARRSANVYGAGHPYTHGHIGNLALLRRLSGDAGEARRLDKHALAALDAALGRDHHFSLTVAANLAGDLAALGDLDAAVRLGRGTLLRLRALLGRAHPMTLACAAGLAADLTELGETREGETLRETTLQIYAQRLYPDHPDVPAAREGRRLDFDFDPLPI